jgi:imidazolonepropionase
MTLKADLILRDSSETLTCIPAPGNPLGRVSQGSVVLAGGRVLGVDRFPALAEQFDLSAAREIDCTGQVIAPGFVDAHTHVVFGGSRVREYALKMTHTAAEIRALGVPAGITASMEMTRAASEAELVSTAAARLRTMLRHGTTTAESKSGYGLSLEHELRLLRVNRILSAGALPPPLPGIVSTFLGAHAFPPGMPPETYVDEIIHQMIPAVAAEDLAVFCDVYIDEGYFNLDQTRRILVAARAAGFRLKIHADQYAALGGAELAAELAVTSADHLNYTSPPVMRRLAAAGVVGVLMPLIDFAVRHPQPFDARAMLDAGMTIALATDICPGGWTESMPLVMQFACRQHALSPEEAMLAATVGGAKALALHDRGALAPGMRADIQIWDVPVFEDVIYRLGSNVVGAVLLDGKVVWAGGGTFKFTIGVQPAKPVGCEAI